MARPRKVSVRTTAEIESALAEEMEQLSLLQRDLRDALILGESTRALRGAIADTEKSIASLRAALDDARALETTQRRAEIEADAAAICEEASTAHVAFLSSLEIPHFSEEESSHASHA